MKWAAAQNSEHNRTNRKEIDAVIVELTAGTLRRHESGIPEKTAWSSAGIRAHMRKVEVLNLYGVARTDEDLFRGQVPIDEADAVHRTQDVEQLRHRDEELA